MLGAFKAHDIADNKGRCVIIREAYGESEGKTKQHPRQRFDQLDPHADPDDSFVYHVSLCDQSLRRPSLRRIYLGQHLRILLLGAREDLHPEHRHPRMRESPR